MLGARLYRTARMRFSLSISFIFGLLLGFTVWYISWSHLKYDSHLQLGTHPDSSDDVRREHGGIARYNERFNERMTALAERKAEARDPELVKLVADAIDLPSGSGILKLSRNVKRSLQAKAVDRLLKSKRNGFFIECGALDGERSSNTLFLEHDRSWNGLLVEMDPYYYTQLLGKGRKSWSINACLSPFQYAIQLPFHGSGGKGKLDLSNKIDKSSTVPCFPLETILLALNRTHVDYFSLDVEGFELRILRTIPFDRLIIDVLSVEYNHIVDYKDIEEGKRALVNLMTKKGYYVEDDIYDRNLEEYSYTDDFIFVRNNSLS